MAKKFPLQRLLILILLVLFSTVVFCGLIYIGLNSVIKIQNEHIKVLTNQINITSEKIHELSSE